jgi:aromatic ring-opening dioxygenase catalytic subunit (LigB family)
MAHVIAGMAASHAFALLEPDAWDGFLGLNRRTYAGRYGQEPPLNPRADAETQEDNRQRYDASIRRGLDALRDRLRAAPPDVVLIVGDDQDENFVDEFPALALYTGDEFTVVDRFKALDGGTPPSTVYRNDVPLASHLYEQTVEAGFDVTAYHRFADGVLKAHAIGPLLQRILPEADVPVVPIFVEAIHVPAPSPARCYAFGQALRQAIARWTGAERVAVCASGGLSHFTAGYPYASLQRLGPGERPYGSISEDFDRMLVERMTRGEGAALASLTTEDLLRHGDVEFRSWLTVLGMVGEAPAEMLAYEPFYRAIMGMGVAFWDCAPVTSTLSA